MLKALLAGLFLILTASVSANQKLDSLLDEIWQFELRINPTMATSRGVHQYDHLLSDVSAEGLKAQYQQAKAYLQQLDKLGGQDLNKQDQISLQMQHRRLQEMVDSYDYNAHYMPITSEYGFHSGLPDPHQ